MRNPTFALLGAAALAIAGCAAPARTGNMVAAPSAPLTGERTALRNAVAVGPVTGGQETNPLWRSKVGNAEFADALRSSLQRAGYLAPRPDSARYMLTAELVELDQPMIGFDMTVSTRVLYGLSDRTAGRPIWGDQIETRYTADRGPLLGPSRTQVANEGAVRENIRQMLDRLARIDR